MQIILYGLTMNVGMEKLLEWLMNSKTQTKINSLLAECDLHALEVFQFQPSPSISEDLKFFVLKGKPIRIESILGLPVFVVMDEPLTMKNSQDGKMFMNAQITTNQEEKLNCFFSKMQDIFETDSVTWNTKTSLIKLYLINTDRLQYEVVFQMPNTELNIVEDEQPPVAIPMFNLNNSGTDIEDSSLDKEMSLQVPKEDLEKMDQLAMNSMSDQNEEEPNLNQEEENQIVGNFDSASSSLAVNNEKEKENFENNGLKQDDLNPEPTKEEKQMANEIVEDLVDKEGFNKQKLDELQQALEKRELEDLERIEEKKQMDLKLQGLEQNQNQLMSEIQVLKEQMQLLVYGPPRQPPPAALYLPPPPPPQQQQPSGYYGPPASSASTYGMYQQAPLNQSPPIQAMTPPNPYYYASQQQPLQLFPPSSYQQQNKQPLINKNSGPATSQPVSKMDEMSSMQTQPEVSSSSSSSPSPGEDKFYDANSSPNMTGGGSGRFSKSRLEYLRQKYH